MYSVDFVKVKQVALECTDDAAVYWQTAVGEICASRKMMRWGTYVGRARREDDDARPYRWYPCLPSWVCQCPDWSAL